jgi:peptidyl-prolyl cis-trans isomerase A (cyclophilin A)
MTTRSIAMTMVVCVALAVPATAVGAQGTSSTAKQTPAKPTTQKPTTQKPAGTAAKPAGTKPKAAASTAKPAAAPAALRTPSKLKEKAPETYQVNFDTSIGSFVVDVTRSWAPIGADRFYNLVKNGFYDGNRFFRVLPGFVAQFGLYGDPKVGALWREATIPDEPVTQSNKRGTLVFAKAAAPNTRTTQLFINFRDNTRLDAGGFAPFGVISSGMEIVDKINAEYGEAPDQGLIQEQGNAYLTKAFPKLDYIKKATIVKAVSK